MEREIVVILQIFNLNFHLFFFSFVLLLFFDSVSNYQFSNTVLSFIMHKFININNAFYIIFVYFSLVFFAVVIRHIAFLFYFFPTDTTLVNPVSRVLFVFITFFLHENIFFTEKQKHKNNLHVKSNTTIQSTRSPSNS